MKAFGIIIAILGILIAILGLAFGLGVVSFVGTLLIEVFAGVLGLVGGIFGGLMGLLGGIFGLIGGIIGGIFGLFGFFVGFGLKIIFGIITVAIIIYVIYRVCNPRDKY